MPLLLIAWIADGMACGNEAMLMTIVLGFLRIICASSCSSYSFPSRLTGRVSIEPVNLNKIRNSNHKITVMMVKTQLIPWRSKYGSDTIDLDRGTLGYDIV